MIKEQNMETLAPLSDKDAEIIAPKQPPERFNEVLKKYFEEREAFIKKYGSVQKNLMLGNV